MDFHGNIPGGRLPDGYLPSLHLRGGGLGLGGDEMARREPAEGVSRKRLLEDEVRRELALERSSASRMRGIDAVPPPVGIPGWIDPPVSRYPSIPDAEIGHFGRQNDLPVKIPQRIEPAVPRYPSIPDAGIGRFDRQDDPPVPRYPSVPDVGIGPIGRQLDPLASLLDPHVPRYPSVPDTAIGPSGGRMDYGQSSELVRGPEFGRMLLSGPRPEFGRSLEFGQGGNWMAAVPGLLPLPYGGVGMMEKPPSVCPPPPRNVNASSLPVVGGKGRTTTRTEIVPVVIGKGRPITRTEIALDSVATEWSCALCKVSTTSQFELDRHLQGKEHVAVAEKANAEKVNAEKVSQNDSMGSPSKKSTEAGEDDPAGKSPEAESSSESDEEAPKKRFEFEMSEVVRAKFECRVCKVYCENIHNLNSHLGGQRHKRSLKIYKSGGKLPELPKRVRPRNNRLRRASEAAGAGAKNRKPASR